MFNGILGETAINESVKTPELTQLNVLNNVTQGKILTKNLSP